nr:MAG TPA: hypothetical protein [Caudoviricetes sp.]
MREITKEVQKGIATEVYLGFKRGSDKVSIIFDRLLMEAAIENNGNSIKASIYSINGGECSNNVLSVSHRYSMADVKIDRHKSYAQYRKSIEYIQNKRQQCYDFMDVNDAWRNAISMIIAFNKAAQDYYKYIAKIELQRKQIALVDRLKEEVKIAPIYYKMTDLSDSYKLIIPEEEPTCYWGHIGDDRLAMTGIECLFKYEFNDDRGYIFWDPSKVQFIITKNQRANFGMYWVANTFEEVFWEMKRNPVTKNGREVKYHF